MDKIDLQGILDANILSERELAVLLFDHNTHPEKSLQRILDNKSELKEKQISILAHRLNWDYNALFGGTWKANRSNPVWCLTNDKLNATVFLNTTDFSFTIFRSGEMIANETLVVKTISLSEFIQTLEQQIV